MSFQSEHPRGAREPSFRMSAKQLGMWIFIASLSVIFIANIVGYLVTRSNNREWRTLGLPGLPPGLFASTAFILLLSLSGHIALRALRSNHYARFKLWLRAMLGFAVVFLIAQAFNWQSMTHVEGSASLKNLYTFTYFMLTGLHALHVLGGFAPLGVVLYKAEQRKYSSSRLEGVALCVQYWDFLGVVWLVLLTTLYCVT